MKWIWSCCRRRREVCLLATGVLGEADKIELQSHLAVCIECRGYYNELKAITAPLAGWEKSLSSIQATPAMRMRWARAIRTADQPDAIEQSLMKEAWQIIWLQFIRPSRRAWMGMAALWVVMAAINAHLSDHQETDASTVTSSTQDMAQSWQERNRVLTELTQPAIGLEAVPPIIPRPRSEGKRDWVTA